MRAFVSNEFPTVGVEQEFHLIDPESGDLVGRMEDVWAALDGRLKESITYEVFTSVLESRSIIARSAGALTESIIADRAELAEACRSVGVRLVAAGTHPFAHWDAQEFVDNEHYRWVRAEHGLIVNRLLAFGLHVHVGMRSAEGAIYVINEMRRWLGPLLAFSANSPYFTGRPSGLASTRWHLFRGMPRTGLAPQLADFADLEDICERLIAAGDINAPGDLWWAIRPQPPLGTVELRIFDLPTDVRRIAAIAAVVQAACAHYQELFEAGQPATDLRRVWLEENEWKAMRYDLDAKIIDAATGDILTLREQLAGLIDRVAPTAEALGSGEQIALARTLLAEPTESQWQIATCEQLGGDLVALEMTIADRTLQA